MVMILVLQGMKLSREGVESKNFLMYVVVVVEGVAKKNPCCYCCFAIYEVAPSFACLTRE